jgi:valyl-tRNA synthetase
MGHALNNTLQDVLIRWHRMRGDKTVWVPGTDHGGIATQNVVEKLLRSEKKTRFDLGREKFIERMWQWRRESGDIILMQLKRLGASCDWTRTRFTMDDQCSRAVRHAFVVLFKKGLIYRGPRMVNWCPRCLTALADIEVEHEDRAGSLWHIRYPLANPHPQSLSLQGEGGRRQGEGIVVATTRPETMLGDTAVAVNPQDDRYKAYIGKKLILPLMNREIPVIADEGPWSQLSGLEPSKSLPRMIRPTLKSANATAFRTKLSSALTEK